MTTHTSEPVSQGAYSSGLLDLSALWRGKWRLAAATLTAVLLGCLYLTVASPMGNVGARILVVDQGTTLAPEGRPVEDRFFLATQAEIIRSPAVIEPVLKTLPAPPLNEPQYDPLSIILENLTVDPLAGTNVLSVKYRHQNGERAVQTLEAIIHSYRRFLLTNEQERHGEMLRLLTEREKELRSESADLQERIRQLRQQGSVLGQGREAGNVQRTMLTDIGQMLSAARGRRIQLENHRETFTALLESQPDLAEALPGRRANVLLTSAVDEVAPNGAAEAKTLVAAPAVPENGGAQGPELLKPPLQGVPMLALPWRSALETLAKLSHDGWVGAEDLQTVQKALLAAQTRETELQQRLGSKHPDLKAVRNQIAALEARLREAVLSAPAALDRELATVRRQEESLAEIYREEAEKVKVLDDALLEEEHVRGEIAQVQTMHEAILTQVKQWQLADQAIAEGRPRVLVRVLEGPVLTNEGVAPPKLVLAFCGLFGAFAGVFWIAWRERGR